MYGVTRKYTLEENSDSVCRLPRSPQNQTIEQIRACDEERRRTHPEESDEDGCTRGNDERTTENNMELRMSTSHEKYRAQRGEETDMAMLGREICSHTGDHT